MSADLATLKRYLPHNTPHTGPFLLALVGFWTVGFATHFDTEVSIAAGIGILALLCAYLIGAGQVRASVAQDERLERIEGLLARIADAVAPGASESVHFQLVTLDGTVLGARKLGGPDWPPGSVIYTGADEPNLRVVRELDTETDDPERHFTVLVVEEL